MNGEIIKRGDVFLVQLDPVIGSEQSGRRPVVVVQNDIGNLHSPTVIVAPITTKRFSEKYPTNVYITTKESGLRHDSTVLLNQIKTIDKERLEKKLAHLPSEIMKKVDEAIKISLGLVEF